MVAYKLVPKSRTEADTMHIDAKDDQDLKSKPLRVDNKELHIKWMDEPKKVGNQFQVGYCANPPYAVMRGPLPEKKTASYDFRRLVRK